MPSTQGGSAGDDVRYKEKQAEIFRQQLEVAAETGLNCVIHQRGDCFEATLALLQPFAAQVRGVFHCFAGDAAAMRRVLALGSLVSFTGIVTFKNGQNVRDTLAATKDFDGVTGKTTINEKRDATKSAVILKITSGKYQYLETVEP